MIVNTISPECLIYLCDYLYLEVHIVPSVGCAFHVDSYACSSSRLQICHRKNNLKPVQTAEKSSWLPDAKVQRDFLLLHEEPRKEVSISLYFKDGIHETTLIQQSNLHLRQLNDSFFPAQSKFSGSLRPTTRYCCKRRNKRAVRIVISVFHNCNFSPRTYQLQETFQQLSTLPIISLPPLKAVNRKKRWEFCWLFTQH